MMRTFGALVGLLFATLLLLATVLPTRAAPGGNPNTHPLDASEGY